MSGTSQYDSVSALKTQAEQCGFHVVDQHGDFFEVEFMGVVDRAALGDFCTAFLNYSLREVQNLSDNDHRDPI